MVASNIMDWGRYTGDNPSRGVREAAPWTDASFYSMNTCLSLLTESCPVADDLQAFYEFSDGESVTEFLVMRDEAAAALGEAAGQITEVFGSAATALIDLIDDPDGSPPMLLVTIRGGNADMLLAGLRTFRKGWWGTQSLSRRRLVAWTVG